MTVAGSAIPEPEFSSFNPWHLRDFLKDIEEDKNSFRITDKSKITAKPGSINRRIKSFSATNCDRVTGSHLFL
jgi:hypothetical protein